MADKEKYYKTLIELLDSNNVEYKLAEPGCAYPFGFSSTIDIYIDPKIYEVDWFLFSPVYPSKTIQAKGNDLKRVFESVNNKVVEVTAFNQG